MNTDTHRAAGAQTPGGAMFETTAREFAAQYPTPNVLRAIALAESGRISWEQVYGLFSKALAAGLAEVTK